MPLALNDASRYARRPYAELDHADGSRRTVWDLAAPLSKSALRPGDWTIHVTSAGDQLDALAYDYMGDSRLWWAIADLNRDVLEDELRIPAGIRLVIPTEVLFLRVGTA